MFNNDDAFLVIFKILYYCYECIKSGKSVELKYLRYEKLCINKEYFAYIMRQLELKNYILYADVVINCWTERINEFYIMI